MGVGGGGGHPRRTSGLSIPSRGKLFPTTPSIFGGHLKIVQNLTQIWGPWKSQLPGDPVADHSRTMAIPPRPNAVGTV